MVLKGLSERLQDVKDKLERAKARVHGMTVPELREHLRKRAADRKAFKVELKEKEQLERKKFEKWKIEQKYRQKRKQAKKGGGGFMETMFGSSGGKQNGSDPLGLFGPQKSSTRKRKAQRRRKR